jgi:hypothetical protein
MTTRAKRTRRPLEVTLSAEALDQLATIAREYEETRSAVVDLAIRKLFRRYFVRRGMVRTGGPRG